MNKMIRNKKGFTLIELIVVIAIIGILAAVAVPRLGGFTTTAKLNADYATASTIANAVAAYGAANPAANSNTYDTTAELTILGYLGAVSNSQSQSATWDINPNSGNPIVTSNGVQFFPKP